MWWQGRISRGVHGPAITITQLHYNLQVATSETALQLLQGWLLAGQMAGLWPSYYPLSQAIHPCVVAT
jgi:hypothetical protein